MALEPLAAKLLQEISGISEARKNYHHTHEIHIFSRIFLRKNNIM
jgi:hypothetical protein